MTFVTSLALLSAVYVLIGRLERTPRLQFRKLSSPRPYLRTDLAWYGVAIAATAVSVFVLQPVLARFAIAPLRDALADVPFVAKLLIGVVVFDLVSFFV